MHAEWFVLLFYALGLPAVGWLAWRLRDWRILALAFLLAVAALPEVDAIVGVSQALSGAGSVDAGVSARVADTTVHPDLGEWLLSAVAWLLAVGLLAWVLHERAQAMRAVADSEKRFRDFAEAASDWLWEMDADLRFTYMSPNVRNIVGVSPEWHYGKTRRDLLGPDYDRAVWDDHLATMEACQPFRNFTFERVAAGIDRRWLRSSGKPYFDDDGNFLGYRGVGSDATDEMLMQSHVAKMEERFRLAIESMDQGFALFDQQDQLLAWNARFVEINADIDDLIEVGATYAGLAAAVATRRRRGASWYEQAIEQHRADNVDVIKRFPDGRWVRVQGRRTRDGGTAMVWTDVTELKQAEQTAAERLRELETITDNIPVVITHVDAEQRFRFVNQLAEDWYRRAGEALIGQRLADVQLAESYRQIRPHAMAALAGQRVRFEAALEYPDGSRRDVEVTFVPERDGTGVVRGFFGLGVDVTEQRRLEQERRLSEQKMANVVAGSLQGIMVYEPGGRVLFANPTAAAIFGFDDVDDLIAIDSIDGLIAPGEQTWLRGYREARLRGEEVPPNYEFEGRTKSDDTIWLVAMSRPVDWDGEPAVLTSVIDVTERRRTEDELRQAQKMEAVGQLTGGVAHDFNNMLTVIQGNADMLRDMLEPGSPPVQLADAVMRAAERSAELTQRLLAFSRQQPLSPKAVDVGALLNGMGSLLSRTLGDHIKVQIRAAAGIEAARVDPGQLENAVLNLSINARDAMPDGGQLVLEARTTAIDAAVGEGDDALAPGRYVEVSVSDSGTGMPADVIARAFDPFFTTKGVGRGTGLGLSMVYGFARQSGGMARIHSELGHGTTIKIYLPVAEAREADDDGDDGQAVALNGHETVLLIEDDPDIAAFASLALRRLGYAVEATGNGAEGLARLRAGGGIDLLLTDVILPGDMNGREIADAPRRLCPAIKVLFMSGYARDALGSNGQIDEGLAFLPKPFTASVLARNVRAVLDDEAA